MLRSITLGDLRGATLDRADVRNRRDRYTPAEVNEYINQSIAALRDLIIQVRGNDYFAVTSSPIAIVQGQTLYTLPTDCYTILSVRADLGGGSGYAMGQFDYVEEPDLIAISAGGSGRMSYRLNSATEIEFLPQGPQGANVYIRYMPPAPRLFDDADELDGFNGWEEYVILDAARKIASKGKDLARIGILKDDLAKVEARIRSLAPKRDRGRPETVKDVRGSLRGRRLRNNRRWWP